MARSPRNPDIIGRGIRAEEEIRQQRLREIGGGAAIVTIAAANTRQRRYADYVCPGSSDQETLAEALLDGHSHFLLLPGDFYFDDAPWAYMPDLDGWTDDADDRYTKVQGFGRTTVIHVVGDGTTAFYPCYAGEFGAEICNLAFSLDGYRQTAIDVPSTPTLDQAFFRDLYFTTTLALRGEPFALLPPHDETSSAASTFESDVSSAGDLFTCTFQVRLSALPTSQKHLLDFGLSNYNGFIWEVPPFSPLNCTAFIGPTGIALGKGQIQVGSPAAFSLNTWHEVVLERRWTGGGHDNRMALTLDGTLVAQANAFGSDSFHASGSGGYDGTLGCATDAGDSGFPESPGHIDFDSIVIAKNGTPVYTADFDEGGGSGTNYQAIPTDRHFEFVAGVSGQALRVGWS